MSVAWNDAIGRDQLVDMTNPFQVLTGVRVLFEIGRNAVRFGFSPVAADAILGPGADEFVDARIHTIFGGFRHDNEWLTSGITSARSGTDAGKVGAFVFRGKWEGFMAIFGPNSFIICGMDEVREFGPLLF